MLGLYGLGRVIVVALFLLGPTTIWLGCGTVAAATAASDISVSVNAERTLSVAEYEARRAQSSPLRPQDLRAVHANHTSITLVWSPPEDRLGQEVVGYVVEVATDPSSDDWNRVASVDGTTLFYTLRDLAASEDYRCRVRAFSATDVGHFSEPIVAFTEAFMTNDWEEVLAQRQARSIQGRGLSATVMNRPHLSTEAQTLAGDASDDPDRYTDTPTRDREALPSPRRGHTMTLLDGRVLMFGGLTEGYYCDASVMNQLYLGVATAGLDVEKCLRSKGESNELWIYDPSLDEWEHVLYNGSNTLPAREQHSASVIDGTLYVFAGVASEDEDVASPVYYNDMWAMETGRNVTVLVTSEDEDQNATITEGEYTFSTLRVSAEDLTGSSSYFEEQYGDSYNADVSNNEDDLCALDVTVTVSIAHPCVRDLSIALYGPGEASFSPNFMPFASANKVLLFSRHANNGTGCSANIAEAQFNDDAPESIAECCHEPYRGEFRPLERLRAFRGISPVGDWTLQVLDATVDNANGTLIDWSLEFVMQECKPRLNFFKVIPADVDNVPVARYQHTAIVAGRSLFVVGGVTSTGRTTDLWRFDVDTRQWTELQTEGLDSPLPFIGRSLSITPFGLMAAFGYHRGQGGTDPPKYEGRVHVQDVSTGLWSVLTVSETYSSVEPYYHRSVGTVKGVTRPELFEAPPRGRTLSYISLLLDNSDVDLYGDSEHESQFPDAFDTSIGAYEIPALAPQLLMFGGDDGIRLLDDFRRLRLNSLTYPEAKWRAASLLQERCKWRQVLGSTAQRDWQQSCNATSVETQTKTCTLRELVYRAYCNRQWQSFGSL